MIELKIKAKLVNIGGQIIEDVGDTNDENEDD